VEGTNKAHENGEAMGFVGVRLTVMLGDGFNIIAIENTATIFKLYLLCSVSTACFASRSDVLWTSRWHLIASVVRPLLTRRTTSDSVACPFWG
jgi:hypothetical protein